MHQEDDIPAHTDFHIGNYKNVSHHSNGLFSEVYKARSPEGAATPGSRKLVALKVTVPSMMGAPHDSEKEARILEIARSEESRIIPLLETFWQAGGRFVLVFEFMRFDLEQLLRKRELTRIQARNCLYDLFKALEHLHSIGILHRDVKPSNVLLRSPSGPAFLADFGIAWKDGIKGSEAADQKITDVGTTHYRPPELLFGDTAYGPALDMWAAGCVVAEVACLRGKSLFDSGELGSDLALVNSHFQSLGTPNDEMWPVGACNVMPQWILLLTRVSRRRGSSVTGERCSFMNIRPSRGPSCSLLVRRMPGISSANWSCTRAPND